MSCIKEKILVASGVSETELLRTLAKNGINTFNMHVMSPYELADYALKKDGILIDKAFIASINEAAIVFNNIKETKYFNDINYEDAIDLMKVIDELRLYITDSNEAISINKLLKVEENKIKNESIVSIYNNYISRLKELNMVDTISIIREAISQKVNLDAEIISYNEFPLKPLEKELLKVVSNGNYKTEFFTENKISIEKFTQAFGIRNEIENVLQRIIKEKIPFDECSIVCIEDILYSQIIIDTLNQFEIPFTSGIGASIHESNVGRLYDNIFAWQDNFSSTDSFISLSNDISFDKEKLIKAINFDESKFDLKSKKWKFEKPLEQIIRAFGDLRIKFNEDNKNIQKVNTCLNHLYKSEDKESITLYEYVLSLVKLWNKGIVFFIKTLVRDNPIHNEDTFLGQLDTLFTLMKDYKLPIKDIKKVADTLSSGGFSSLDGAIHITTLGKALSSIRPHVFIVGLSNDNFPGAPKENPYLLDSDFNVFNILRMSEAKIKEKKETFYSLLHASNKFNAKVYLSYASYNETTLKEQNSSSVIYECFRQIYGLDKSMEEMNIRFNKNNDDHFEKVTFFDAPLSKNISLGKKYRDKVSSEIKDNKITIQTFMTHEDTNEESKVEENFNKLKALYDKSYSASAIVTFNECQYKFYLENILRLNNPYTRDEFNVIQANDLGTIVHAALEEYDPYKDSKEDLIKNGQDKLDEYLIFHIPVNKETTEITRKDLERILSNAHSMIGKNASIFKEEDIYKDYKDTGIKVHGLPDSVIKVDENTCSVVDYKVKNHVEHKEDDPFTQLQILLYAYLYKEKFHKEVTKGYYYYLKQNNIIPVDISENSYALDETISNMKNAFDTGVFKLYEPKGKKDELNPCRYCKFNGICRKEDK